MTFEKRSFKLQAASEKMLRKSVEYLPVKRISCILLALLGSILSGYSTGIDQVKVSLDCRQLPLSDALGRLAEQADLQFVWDAKKLDLTLFTVTIHAKDQYLNMVLEQMLAPHKLTYEKAPGNIIVIKRAIAGGAIKGKVTDENSQGLIGATVRIEGTAKGAVTDVNGVFMLENLKPGIYTLEVSFIGYATRTVRDIRIQEAKVSEVNIQLEPSHSQLDEVVVKAGIDVKNADVAHSTERTLIDEIHKSDLIVTGISNVQIARSLDFNAAEVVRRAPGVSVINNFINIRGLYERYNMVYINGMIAPSSESDKRAFSFDLLPSGIIDRIMIHRNPAPELPGDFVGGLVKIHTKEAMPARQLQVKLSSQYRQGTSFTNAYTYKGGKTDWLGFDDGTRALPDAFPARGELPVIHNAGTPDPQVVAENAGYARKLDNNWNLIKNNPVGADYRGTLEYYDSWSIGDTRLNNLTSVFYSRENSTLSQDFRNGPEDDPDVRYADSIFNSSARIGAMQNFMLKINDRHSLRFNNFFNQLGRDQTMLRLGKEHESFSPQDSVLQVQYLWEERSIYAGQLAGSHVLGEKKHTVEWGGGYTHIREYIPNARRYEIRMKPGDLPGINHLVATDEVGGEGFEFNLENYQATTERAYNYFTNTEWALPYNMRLKTGVFTEFKSRDFDNRYITIRPGPAFEQQDGTLSLSGTERQYHLHELFGRNYRINGSGFIVRDQGLEGSAYTAYQDYYAGYLGLTIPLISERLKMYGGVRHEWNRFILINERTSGATVRDVDQLTRFWLPAVNVNWILNSRMNVRASWGKSLNRPQFRELSSFKSFDLDEGYLAGNPELKTAEIQNYDLRWEYYPSEGQWISTGVFYKNFTNPIEYISATQSSALRELTAIRNISGAQAYGVELEVRKRLDFIPGRLPEQFSILLNAAYMWNQARLTANDITYGGSDLRDTERPLQGTSPYIINTTLYYDNEKTGTLLSVQYNTFGQRLFRAASMERSDIFEMPRHSLDISVKQQVFKDFEIQAGVKNLLNQPYRYYRDYYRDGKYDSSLQAEGTTTAGGGNIKPGSDYYHRYYREGRYYSLGIVYIFR